MLDQTQVFETLERHGVRFFTGVPDSYLNSFCSYALANCGARNIIAANEGNAVSIAAGHFLACRELPLVYMQNSGMGNALNPLVSLTDRRVYAVPMLLLIGWRGKDGTEPNHPQHTLQGHITPALLELLEIPYSVLPDDIAQFAAVIETSTCFCRKHRRPYALLAPKGVMAASKKANETDARYPMSREEAIEVLLDRMPPDTVFAATTGRASRELFFLRERRGESMARDFLNVGAMGHVSSVALGIALERPERPVVVLDGDGAAIMHMGALTMVSKLHAPNYLHVVLNNGAHESVGGQPSAGQQIDFTRIAEGCGYATVGHPISTRDELCDAIVSLRGCGKAAFIDCRIHKGLASRLPPIVFDHRAAADTLMDELNRP